MLLKENLKISKYSKTKFVISFDDSYFIVNKNTANLIKAINENENWDSAYNNFLENNSTPLKFDDFKYIADNKLKEFGLYKDSKKREKKFASKYIRLKMQLISPKYAGKIGNVFSFLFSPALFWSIFSIILIVNTFNGINAIYYDYYQAVSFNNSIILILLLVLSTFFHEMGHISSCRKFGLKNGGIGFGFYLIFPVAYSDVTAVWGATKNKRIIVNSAGIYMEFIYSSILIVISYIFNINLLGFIAFLIFINTIYQLNPFLRYDGYWILSDLTETPNLRTRSLLSIKNLITKNGKNGKMGIKKIFLLFYGFGSMMIIFAFIFFIYRRNTLTILSFPKDLLDILIDIFKGNFNSIDLPNGFFISLIFYILLTRFVFGYLKRIILRIRKKSFNSQSE